MGMSVLTKRGMAKDKELSPLECQYSLMATAFGLGPKVRGSNPRTGTREGAAGVPGSTKAKLSLTWVAQESGWGSIPHRSTTLSPRKYGWMSEFRFSPNGKGVSLTGEAVGSSKRVSALPRSRCVKA
jgi:hypothetical protein